MPKIKYALGELQRISRKINFFNSLLDGILVLLLFFAIFKVFLISLYLAIIPAIIWMLISWYYRNKNNIMRDLEKKVPELREELRTAADNLDEDNEVVRSLQNDVLRKMKKIKSSHFLSYQGLFKKIVMMSFLSFVVIVIASVNVSLDVPKIEDIGSNGVVGKFFGSENDLINEGRSDRDLYGDESFIELGNDELEIKIQTLESEIDLNNIETDFEIQEFNTNMFPSDMANIQGVGASNFKEEISKENSEIVKKYYNDIATN